MRKLFVSECKKVETLTLRLSRRDAEIARLDGELEGMIGEVMGSLRDVEEVRADMERVLGENEDLREAGRGDVAEVIGGLKKECREAEERVRACEREMRGLRERCEVGEWQVRNMTTWLEQYEIEEKRRRRGWRGKLRRLLGRGKVEVDNDVVHWREVLKAPVTLDRETVGRDD